jgi:hypothetical protein
MLIIIVGDGEWNVFIRGTVKEIYGLVYMDKIS